MFEWQKNAADPQAKFHCRAHSAAVIDREAIKAWGLTLPDNSEQPVDSAAPVFYLSPNEWLVFNPGLDINTFREQLGALAPEMVITDISDRYESMALSRQEGEALLAQGCNIAAGSKGMKVGHFACTRLFDVPVIICRSEAGGCKLYIDRSLARYFTLWSET